MKLEDLGLLRKDKFSGKLQKPHRRPQRGSPALPLLLFQKQLTKVSLLLPLPPPPLPVRLLLQKQFKEVSILPLPLPALLQPQFVMLTQQPKALQF